MSFHADLPPSLLLIEYVAATALNHDAENAIARKDKRPLPLPVSLVLCNSCSDSWMLVLLLAIPANEGNKTILICTSDELTFWVGLLHVYYQMGCTSVCYCSPRYPISDYFSANANLFAAVSIAGIICEKLNVLCDSSGFDVHFANVYLEAVDFVSIRCVVHFGCESP